jgi:peroxiredoxin
MEAYRDQYATLFNNGRNVVVIGVSVDADTTQAAWARESEFPILFASDSGGRIGQLYDAYDAKNAMDNRSLFVIGPDGRIAYVAKPFRVLSANAYTELGDVVDRLTKGTPGGGTH